MGSPNSITRDELVKLGTRALDILTVFMKTEQDIQRKFDRAFTLAWRSLGNARHTSDASDVRLAGANLHAVCNVIRMDSEQTRNKALAGEGLEISRKFSQIRNIVSAESDRGDLDNCDTPGMKLRSQGLGRGLAVGKGEGPIGIPVGYKENVGANDIDILIERVANGVPVNEVVEELKKLEEEQALQYTDDCRDERDAREQLKGLEDQEGFLGGRVLPPGPGKPKWRIQAFFQDDSEFRTNTMQGMRRVTILPQQKKLLGIK